MLTLHAAALHTWLLLTLRHAPAPSQVPSFPHWLVAVSSMQVLWGFRPASAGAQVPSLFPVSVFEQALQPVQVVAQQTPSTQLPRAQSLASEHGAPTCPVSFWSTGASITTFVPPPPPFPPVEMMPPLPTIPPVAMITLVPSTPLLPPVPGAPPVEVSGTSGTPSERPSMAAGTSMVVSMGAGPASVGGPSSAATDASPGWPAVSGLEECCTLVKQPAQTTAALSNAAVNQKGFGLVFMARTPP
jgi:hypothetical protein